MSNPLDTNPTRLWAEAGRLFCYLFGVHLVGYNRCDILPLVRRGPDSAELPVGYFQREDGYTVFLCREGDTCEFAVYLYDIAEDYLLEVGRVGVPVLRRHNGTGPDDTEPVPYFRATVPPLPPPSDPVARGKHCRSIERLTTHVFALVSSVASHAARAELMARMVSYRTESLVCSVRPYPVCRLTLPTSLNDWRLEGWRQLSGHALLMLMVSLQRETLDLSSREAFYACIGVSGPPLRASFRTPAAGSVSWLRPQPVPVIGPEEVLDAADDDIPAGDLPAEPISGVARSPEVQLTAQQNQTLLICMDDVPDDVVRDGRFMAAVDTLLAEVARLRPDSQVSMNLFTEAGRRVFIKPTDRSERALTSARHITLDE